MENLNKYFDCILFTNKIKEVMYPKFVLLDNNELILGNCKYHEQLVPLNRKCLGGGWFIGNEEIILYLNSEKYGAVSLDDIKKVEKVIISRRDIEKTSTERIYFANIGSSITYNKNEHKDNLVEIYTKRNTND